MLIYCAPLLILITHSKVEKYIQKAIANTINVEKASSATYLAAPLNTPRPRDKSMN